MREVRLRLSGLWALLLITAVIGGLAGALVWSQFFDEDREPQRGTIVKLGPPDSLPDIATTPFCLESQHFCIVQLEYGRLIALYTYDTHTYFRSQGCEIPWRADFPFQDPATQKTTEGWFRTGCSGTTFRMDGECVFGPCPRDMDRFALSIVEGPGDLKHIEVDTRRLICGRAKDPRLSDCEWAPLPQ